VVKSFQEAEANPTKARSVKYAIEEEAFIYDQTEDTYKHLVGYLKYVRKKRYQVWIAFDNVDRVS